MPLMAGPTSTRRRIPAERLRPRLSSGSLICFATDRSRRFWSAWWTVPCSTSGNCAPWPTRSRRQREASGKMLDLLLESALRSLALGVAVWLSLALLRVRNPHAHMTAWPVVLVASLAMPVLMHRLTVTIPATAPPLRVAESLSSTLSGPLLEQFQVPALPLALPPVTAPDIAKPPHPVTPDQADRRGPGSSDADWRALPAALYLVVA